MACTGAIPAAAGGGRHGPGPGGPGAAAAGAGHRDSLSESLTHGDRDRPAIIIGRLGIGPGFSLRR